MLEIMPGLVSVFERGRTRRGDRDDQRVLMSSAERAAGRAECWWLTVKHR